MDFIDDDYFKYWLTTRIYIFHTDLLKLNETLIYLEEEEAKKTDGCMLCLFKSKKGESRSSNGAELVYKREEKKRGCARLLRNVNMAKLFSDYSTIHSALE